MVSDDLTDNVVLRPRDQNQNGDLKNGKTHFFDSQIIIKWSYMTKALKTKIDIRGPLVLFIFFSLLPTRSTSGRWRQGRILCWCWVSYNYNSWNYNPGWQCYLRFSERFHCDIKDFFLTSFIRSPEYNQIHKKIYPI